MNKWEKNWAILFRKSLWTSFDFDGEMSRTNLFPFRLCEFVKAFNLSERGSCVTRRMFYSCLRSSNEKPFLNWHRKDEPPPGKTTRALDGNLFAMLSSRVSQMTESILSLHKHICTASWQLYAMHTVTIGGLFSCENRFLRAFQMHEERVTLKNGVM